MGLITRHSLLKLGILSLLFTGLPSFGLTKTHMGKEGRYERQEHEYVLSPTREVTAYCDAGDALVKGECEGHSEKIVPSQDGLLLNDLRPDTERGIYLDSKEVSESGRQGWACWSKVVRPDEELRVTTALTCKKNDNNKASQIKTPRNRGA